MPSAHIRSSSRDAHIVTHCLCEWGRGVVRASGLLGEDFPDSDSAACSWAGANPDPTATQQPGREELQRQLDAARAEAEGWRALHAQLHAFCVDQLLPAPS